MVKYSNDDDMDISLVVSLVVFLFHMIEIYNHINNDIIYSSTSSSINYFQFNNTGIPYQKPILIIF